MSSQNLQELLDALKTASEEFYAILPKGINDPVVVEKYNGLVSAAVDFHLAVERETQQGRLVILKGEKFHAPVVIGTLGLLHNLTCTYYATEHRSRFCGQGCNMVTAETVEVQA